MGRRGRAPHERKRTHVAGAFLCCVLGLACSESAAPPRDAASATSAAIAVPVEVSQLLESIKRADTEQLAISEEDGRFLRLMVVASRATRALEIGGASGYSAIWIGMGLRQTGGRLTTIEYDPQRAKILAGNLRRAGLADVVTVVAGDAFTEIPKRTGDFDFVFLDAWKRDYRRFFDLIFPRVSAGGLFLAHNVVNKRGEMEDFLSAIENNPAAMTSIVSPSHEGMSVTWKGR
jgi:predicted O-methyltransferase YrrM